MANVEIDLSLFVKKIKSQKWTIVKWAIFGSIIGVVIGFSMPKEYASTVVLAPESAGAGNSSQVGNFASMMGVNIGGANAEGINNDVYPQIISSTPFLMEFVDIPVNFDNREMALFNYMSDNQKMAWWGYIMSFPIKVYGWIRGANKAVGSNDVGNLYVLSDSLRIFKNNLASRIGISENKESKTFSLTVRMQDPVVATIVVDSLVAKLQKYITVYRTTKTRQELASTEKMRDEAQARYYQLDTNYAKKADRNQNIITRTGMIELDRLGNERDLAFQLYKQLASQTELTKIKLLEISSIATVIEPPIVPNEAESPNKKIIAIAFLFLGVVAALLKILIGMLRKENAYE